MGLLLPDNACNHFSPATDPNWGEDKGEKERKALLFGSVKSSVETHLFSVILGCRTDKKKNPNNIMISFCLLCLPPEHTLLLLVPFKNKITLEDPPIPSGQEYIDHPNFV